MSRSAVGAGLIHNYQHEGKNVSQKSQPKQGLKFGTADGADNIHKYEHGVQGVSQNND